jgi:hypothetical protein
MIDRLLASIRAIIRAEFSNYRFNGIYEYSIDSTDGTTVDASPVDTSIGLPHIAKVVLASDNIGSTSVPTVGKLCRVMFLNGSPTRPICVGCDGDPVSMSFASGILPAARMGDMAGPFPIVATAVKVLI